MDRKEGIMMWWRITKALIPFLVELFGDANLIRKGKKDLPAWFRVGMVSAGSVSIDIWYLYKTTYMCVEWDQVALCVAPYCFFDPLLNKLRGKSWTYKGQTKTWDLVLAKLNLNPYLEIVLRAILFVVLLIYAVL